MSISNMNWKQLETFYLVATAKSLNDASRIMSLSQGAISRQVALLERDLGIKLFFRHHKGMILTPAGNSILQHVKSMHAEAAKLKMQLKAIKGNSIGNLKVSAPVALGTYWLIPRITKFNSLHPDITISLSLTDNEADLSIGDSHIALRYPVIENLNLVRRRLKTIGFYPFAAASYLSKSNAPKRPEELDDHHIISYSLSSEKEYDKFNWILSAGKNTNRIPTLQVDNLYACYLAIKNGLGIGVIPEYFTWEDETIIKIFPEYKSIYERQLSLYYPSELRGLNRLKIFSEFICKEMESDCQLKHPTSQ